MPAALSAGGCWFPWQQGTEGAGRLPGRGREALAGVTGHPARTPDMVAGLQRPTHPAWSRVPRPSGEAHGARLASPRVGLPPGEGKSGRHRGDAPPKCAGQAQRRGNGAPRWQATAEIVWLAPFIGSLCSSVVHSPPHRKLSWAMRVALGASGCGRGQREPRK